MHAYIQSKQSQFFLEDRDQAKKSNHPKDVDDEEVKSDERATPAFERRAARSMQQASKEMQPTMPIPKIRKIS